MDKYDKVILRIIIVCSKFKFFAFFHFYDTLTKIYNLFNIPIKLISRQAAACSLIPTLFQ